MNLHPKAQRILALLAVAFACSTAAALDTPIAPYEPVQGAWYPIGKPGIYVNVDVGPTGFTFVSIHDFANGVERVRYLQGPLERSSDADSESTGLRARMRSRVYVQEGGSCIGCPYVPETTRDLNQGDAEVRFLDGSAGTLVLEGQAIPIARYGMFADASGLLQNRLAGRWAMASRTRLGDRVDTVTITPYPLPSNSFFLAPADVSDPAPPPGRSFVISCDTCSPLDAPPFAGGFALLVAHDDGKMVVYNGGGGFGIHTFRAAYRLTDLEGVIQGRGIPSAVVDNALDPLHAVIRDFTLVSLPSDWTLAVGAARMPITPYRPVQGSWYPVGKPGIYVNVDVGPTGFTFVSIQDFDAQGRERTRYLQGSLQTSIDADWESTGIRARLQSRVYVQEGGSCLDCPYVAERTRDLNQGDAEVRFLNGSTGSLVLEGQVIPIERYAMYNGDAGRLENRLEGRWLMTSRLPQADRVDTVTIKPFVRRPGATIGLFGPADVPDPYPASSRWFTVTCDTCNASRGWPLSDGLLIAHDGGKLVFYNFYSGYFGTLDYKSYKAAYRLTDREGMIEGREIPSYRAAGDAHQIAIVVGGALDFKLVRLPSDWRQ
ncbi:hypothetical protein BWI17_03245 [Betaproteobacteria bacterium GR16-43]|nr:hypothetical protein BWI17_03245 [Betaproteobacteria bacterium GR16-43]